MNIETKLRIVIDNYFKKECDVNTSIREAFERGFRIGVKKGRQLTKKVYVVTTEVSYGGETPDSAYATKEAALKAWYKSYPHMVKDGYIDAPGGIRGTRYITSDKAINPLVIYIYEMEVRDD